MLEKHASAEQPHADWDMGLLMRLLRLQLQMQSLGSMTWTSLFRRSSS